MSGNDVLALEPVKSQTDNGAVSPMGLLSEKAAREVACKLRNIVTLHDVELDRALAPISGIIKRDLDNADRKKDNAINKDQLRTMLSKADSYYKHALEPVMNRDSSPTIEVDAMAEVFANHALQFARLNPRVVEGMCSPQRVPTGAASAAKPRL